MTIKDNEPAPGQDTASVLFGMDGVAVTETERGAGGRLAVWGRVTLPAVCPGCGTVSGKVHQYVTARPRDVRACGQDVDLFLVKRRMRCAEAACPRRTFTEWVPQVPPRCVITRRLLGHAAAEVTERGITPAEAGRDAGISWPSAHGAFTQAADQVLDDSPAPVAGTREKPSSRPGSARVRAVVGSRHDSRVSRRSPQKTPDLHPERLPRNRSILDRATPTATAFRRPRGGPARMFGPAASRP